MTPASTSEIDVDAFPDAPSDADAVRRIEDASGASSGDAEGFTKLEMMAVLQDGKFSAATNGQNYDLKFEVDVEGFVRASIEVAKGKSGWTATWNQIHIGDGAELKSGGWTRDADGQPHYKLGLHLPESEIARSLGRLAAKGGARAKLVLEPMQGSLGLPDGSVVDLSSRAD